MVEVVYKNRWLYLVVSSEDCKFLKYSLKRDTFVQGQIEHQKTQKSAILKFKRGFYEVRINSCEMGFNPSGVRFTSHLGDSSLNDISVICAVKVASHLRNVVKKSEKPGSLRKIYHDGPDREISPY